MNRYDILKTIGQVILPAIITCVITILKEFKVPNIDSIHIILTALLTCYNSCIVVWNSNYYKKQAEDQAEIVNALKDYQENHSEVKG